MCPWHPAPGFGLTAWLPDPELVDEQGPEGVELVVADSCGQHHQGAGVVQRDPGRLVDQFAVDPRPEAAGRVGITRFEHAGLCHLGVDQPVAELAVVDVGRIVREEGAAGEQRADVHRRPPPSATCLDAYWVAAGERCRTGVNETETETGGWAASMEHPLVWKRVGAERTAPTRSNDPLRQTVGACQEDGSTPSLLQNQRSFRGL